MVWHNLDFGGVPTLRSPAQAKPLTRWKKVKVPVYPLERSREGVGQWTFFLGCVRLVHGNMGNQLLSQINTRFPPFRPKREFSPLSAGTR